MCPVMIVYSLQIRGYPTIKFFPSGPKEFSSAKDYDGGRTSSDIEQWAMNHYTETLPAPEVNEVSNYELCALHHLYLKSW